jgi:hypothetical protein
MSRTPVPALPNPWGLLRDVLEKIESCLPAKDHPYAVLEGTAADIRAALSTFDSPKDIPWTPVDIGIQFVNLSKHANDEGRGKKTLRVGPTIGNPFEWTWELTDYGYTANEEEAKKAAIQAALGES